MPFYESLNILFSEQVLEEVGYRRKNVGRVYPLLRILKVICLSDYSFSS